MSFTADPDGRLYGLLKRVTAGTVVITDDEVVDGEHTAAECIAPCWRHAPTWHALALAPVVRRERRYLRRCRHEVLHPDRDGAGDGEAIPDCDCACWCCAGLTPKLPAGEAWHLPEGTTGRWRVETAKSVHELDLNAGTWARNGGAPVSIAAWGLRPRLGQKMLIWTETASAWQWHLSSHVVRISRMEGTP